MAHTTRKLSVLCLVFCLHAAASACQLTVFGNDSKAPKYWLDGDTPRGILVEMMNVIGDDMGCEFQIELMPWARALNIAEAGRGAIIGFSYTDARAELFDYSDEMFLDELLIVVKKGREFEYNSLDDLLGKSIGITKDASYGSAFDAAVDQGIFSLVANPSRVGQFRMLLSERVDAVIVGPGIAGFNAIIGSDGYLRSVEDQFSILPAPMKNDPNYLGISKSLNADAFLNSFNASLKKLRESEEYDAILEMYAE